MKVSRIIFQSILALSLFSLWAGFALFVVNRLFYKTLPAYTIGRLCIWELVAIIIAVFISQMLIKRSGAPRIETIDGKKIFAMPMQFTTYFSVYFLLATVIAIWQFYLFSLQY